MHSDAIFRTICESHRLHSEQAHQLESAGFVVLPSIIPEKEMLILQQAYEVAMALGEGSDYNIGSSTTRLYGLINRGTPFESLYRISALLAASCLVIRAPFKLSSMLGRTLRAHTEAQELHRDLGRDSDAIPMIGFIVMVDDFRPDNGATRFVPGSHLVKESPGQLLTDLSAHVEPQVLACGAAGSVVIFDASVRHGHAANPSDDPRRSIQGYFVPRSSRSGPAISSQLKPEVLARLDPIGKHLLALEG